ncbi:TIGR01906 family membrane protein [Streptococcus plurextorum]|uniref:TIGR01906 family membrane protein n=1 Tax=Streptococcus plurextorum TaxID=456876 RepID=UPI00041C9D73|nr:TIGR01906 family membrane protein [Streptococcus plurextorum]
MKTRLFSYLTLVWLLTIAVLATIYGAWLFYPLEVDSLKLTEQVPLAKPELLENYNILLTYLTSPFSQVLDMPDFPSSASGLKHFADVKMLFHLVQVIFLATSYPAVRFLVITSRTKSLWSYQQYFLTAALVPLGIGVFGVLIGFEQFFTLFHQLLFPGDSSWLFNPATDPIISVLSEMFFLHCFILFLVLYEVLMLGMFGKCRKMLKRA